MNFTETDLPGAFIIEPDKFTDERGAFTRFWSQGEFAERGLQTQIVECNASFNAKKFTVRGMHYQAEPFSQVKLVRCPKGAIFDVIVDLRPSSPTFKRWTAIELSEANGLLVYVPRGVAHGFQTLADDSEVAYQMGEVYAPEYARGVRWNDPVFNIRWPEVNSIVINERDQNFPDFQT
jgi:dTDP-4-dehydrorhamnose 3,5-epimerase